MTEQAGPGAARVRLQRFLSDAGVASRRRAEELILEGRVLVNDRVVDTLPAFVDPEHDRVVVDGAVVRPEPLEYYILHKPPGVVCTDRDPGGRTRAIDLLPRRRARLFIVGRLDADSSGLLLLTNDGELAQRIAHPRFGVPKVYRAEVRGRVPEDLPQRMLRGVWLSEGKARASQVRVVHRGRERSTLEITLREGRNRQVRRMLARLGYPVRRLKRVAIGPLRLRGLAPGAWRPLTSEEVSALRRAVQHAAPAAGTGAGGAPVRRGRRGGREVAQRDAQARRGTSRAGPVIPRRRVVE